MKAENLIGTSLFSRNLREGTAFRILLIPLPFRDRLLLVERDLLRKR